MNLQSLPGWLAAFVVIAIIFGAVSKIIVMRYISAGKYQAGNTGYFWRAARNGDRAAVIVAVSDVLGIMCLFLLVIYFAIKLFDL
ncbi:hypothetical protein KR767_17435 [Luteibacter anthropi]|uniref:Uncharacterized protein n=1 Tax=Luteibacter anthropi TaxID=564369 RepID=A0A7X5U826_9GAMM|nr:hypothetical protein [Luteibacter anthropi]URX61819.1 hypothetical protein KR767_17435 [Luteibacter anthropi]